MPRRDAKALDRPKMGRRNPGNVPLKLSARDEQALRYGRGGQADDTRWLPEAAAGAMQAAGTDRLFRIALGAVAKALGRAAPVFRSSPAGQGGVHVPRAAATEADREALALYDRLLDGRKFAELPRDAQLDVMRRTGWQELPTGETVKQLPRFEFGPGWTRYEPYATETRAVLSGVAENGVESIPPMTMSEAFAGKGADEFFGYYPNARRWLVRAGAAPAERVMGFSEPGSTAVTVTDEGLMRGAEPVLNTAHHETQHVVQNMSGMSPGSTSADALAELKAGVGNALLDGRGSDPAVIRAVDSLQQAIKSSDPAYHAYQHAGGEAGAFAAGNAAVEGRAGELITDAMSREGIAPENVYDLRVLRQDNKGGETRADTNGGKARGKYPGSLNNPGNVEKRRTRRAGEMDSPHDRWAKFDTPQNGLAASAAVVREIAESKLAAERKPFTIRNYAEKYAPRSENDTDAYVRNLSKYSGIGADDVLDLWDTDAMSRLLRAKVRFESGVPHSQWFTDDEYRAAAEAMKEGAFD